MELYAESVDGTKLSCLTKKELAPLHLHLAMPGWDERYRSGEHSNDAPHPLVVEYAATLTPGRALDLACGAGRHALYLAERGWQVTAVDSSQVAIEILRERARKRGIEVDARIADLERGEFVIEPETYDLIVVTCYLQRDLFPAIKAGLSLYGVALAVIAMEDDDPIVKPMNPAFLLQPGELRSYLEELYWLRDVEEKAMPGRRAMAEAVVRRME